MKEDELDLDEEEDLVALICMLMILLIFSPSGLIMNLVKSEWMMLR